jgi:hypothetical protein
LRSFLQAPDMNGLRGQEYPLCNLLRPRRRHPWSDGYDDVRAADESTHSLWAGSGRCTWPGPPMLWPLRLVGVADGLPADATNWRGTCGCVLRLGVLAACARWRCCPAAPSWCAMTAVATAAIMTTTMEGVRPTMATITAMMATTTAMMGGAATTPTTILTRATPIRGAAPPMRAQANPRGPLAVARPLRRAGPPMAAARLRPANPPPEAVHPMAVARPSPAEPLASHPAARRRQRQAAESMIRRAACPFPEP